MVKSSCLELLNYDVLKVRQRRRMKKDDTIYNQINGYVEVLPAYLCWPVESVQCGFQMVSR